MNVAQETPLHRTFCNNVKVRRQSLGLTQHDVARKLGVSQPTYAAIEAGRREPGLETIARVAKALSISPAELLVETPAQAVA